MTSRKKLKHSSSLSHFFRNASSREKKRVYIRALKEAAEEQRAVIESVQKAKHSQ